MHGTAGGRPPGRGPGNRGPAWRLVGRALLREAAVGCALRLAMGRDPRLNAAVCAAAFATLLVLTYKHGLLKRGTGLGAVAESSVLLVGALMFRDLLVLLPALLGRP